ncbi:hypothetical protein GGR57DRAFT_150119 [Xylariaceae sp. FL1272]|nr:hypothetical protein GGR57DRAFT_150119 [Xylariaceae sp. FL1272]
MHFVCKFEPVVIGPFDYSGGYFAPKIHYSGQRPAVILFVCKFQPVVIGLFHYNGRHFAPKVHYSGRQPAVIFISNHMACKFVFSRSKWGVLGSEKDPAGVVFLDLLFTEPSNSQLRGATVTLTLDEHGKGFRDHFPLHEAPEREGSQLPVHTVSHGPSTLAGQPTRAVVYHKMSFKSCMNAGRFAELGGTGREYGRKMVAQSRWRFTSQTQANSIRRCCVVGKAATEIDKRCCISLIEWQI